MHFLPRPTYATRRHINNNYSDDATDDRTDGQRRVDDDDGTDGQRTDDDGTDDGTDGRTEDDNGDGGTDTTGPMDDIYSFSNTTLGPRL